MTRDYPLHLYLYNSNDQNCQYCHSNSSNFTITRRDTATATASSTLSPNGGHKNPIKLGLGLGLGLGVPLLIIIAGSTILFCLRRPKRQDNAHFATLAAEQPVDWKLSSPPVANAWYDAPPNAIYVSRPEVMRTTQTEVDGRGLVELPPGQTRTKVPAQPVHGERLELEGDLLERRQDEKRS
jgi:hypothetical protein